MVWFDQDWSGVSSSGQRGSIYGLKRTIPIQLSSRHSSIPSSQEVSATASWESEFPHSCNPPGFSLHFCQGPSLRPDYQVWSSVPSSPRPVSKIEVTSCFTIANESSLKFMEVPREPEVSPLLKLVPVRPQLAVACAPPTPRCVTATELQNMFTTLEEAPPVLKNRI